mgnify:CR=1 FL=1
MRGGHDQVCGVWLDVGKALLHTVGGVKLHNKCRLEAVCVAPRIHALADDKWISIAHQFFDFVELRVH